MFLSSLTFDDTMYEQLRLEAFEITWSKIDSIVKEVLRGINVTLFEEIRQWVFESFSTIRSTGLIHIMKPYPITTGAACKRIPTALVFTKNIESVDDLLMFQDLKGYMQSNGCHAAFLSASDISIKHGIGSCLRSLYRQLVSEASDVVDVPLIASWYCKYENYDKPIIFIIDNMERCDSAVLTDFIEMLSEWVMKIPIIFILGVTTTFDALRKFLPSSVMHNLQLCKLTLESPGRRMDSLIEYVLVRSWSGFFIGHKIALFLRNHFLRHDGTITSFLKALKLACVKHFSGEPLSFLCLGMLHEDSEAFWTGSCESLSEVLRSYAFDLPSCQRGKANWDNNLAQGLSKLKWLQNSWSSVILMNKEVKKLRSMINLSRDGHTSKEKHTANIHWSLKSSIRGKGTPFLNDEAEMLLVSMLRKFLVPIESVPFHEIFCFKDVASLKSALIGDQRRVIQDDLLKSDWYLQSTSCSKRVFFILFHP